MMKKVANLSLSIIEQNLDVFLILLLKVFNIDMKSQQHWPEFQCLHPLLIQSLKQNHLDKPTLIQAEVFNCYQHYHDFLIAAQTGSGKTLAFAAPIISQLQYIKQMLNAEQLPHRIIGLILTPTRQLAQQIYNNIELALSHINKNIPYKNQIKLACIIGGMSKEKQLRVLHDKKPQIIIGTPGRLHELLDEEVLMFQNLKYLVIDEADRMIQMGHFKQIDEILEKIFLPKKQEFFDKDFKKITKQLESNEKKEQFYIKAHGKKQKISFNLNSFPTEQLFEVPEDMFKIIQFDHPEQTGQKNMKKANKKSKQAKSQPMVSELSAFELSFFSKLKRRIFFISATLTRQFKGTKYFIKKTRTQQDWKNKKEEQKLKRKEKEKEIYGKNRDKKKDDKKDQKEELEQTIPKLKALLSRAQFSQKPKIIDQSSLLFLPEKLTEKVCYTQGQEQRISILLCYLMQLPKAAKAIIFSNTIKSCRRIQYFIEAFGFQAVNLHSHMQQKQRLKKMQKFKKSTLCNLLVATDVAARGLDFNINYVIQVGVPVNGDTYVHRAGRTARANREGQAFILVDKKEANRWGQINDIINQTTPTRKVHKFGPTQVKLEQIRQKVDKVQWMRRNTQQAENKKMLQRDEQDAEHIGVQIQKEQVRKKYDLDNQEKEIIRHQIKKTTNAIKSQQKQTKQQTDHGKWRKNKLVLSLDEIKKLL